MTDILVYTEEQDNVIAGSVEPREIVVAVVGEVGGGSGGGGGAVDSVNGQLGHVVLDAADVGADAAGTATSAVAAHTGAADPHPQYLTGAEGDAAYDASGAATSAVAAHVAASDPHPQYTTQSEGDARYERGLTAGTNITIDRTNPAAPVISASGGGGGGGAVDSVNGQTGVVVLDTDDIAEGVSNLYFTNGRAAAAAPVQTVDGQAGAVSLSSSYAPLSHVGAGGAAHSNAVAAGAAGFMTGADKTKLDGIAAGATQNSLDAFLLARGNHTGSQTSSTISDFASAARAQTEAELVAGSNVTITPSGTGATRQLTMASAGANLTTTTSSTTLTVNSDTGTDAVLPAATPSVAGVLTAADKTKLDGVAAGATVNSADAVLLARANHTGTQLSSTISDFVEATQDVIGAAITAGTNVTVSYNDTTGLTTIDASGGGITLPVVRPITGNETLALANINTFGVNSTTNNYTSTIPAQAAVAWTADAELHFLPSNTGDITITAAAGVSLNGVVGGSLTLSTQNGAATLKRTGADSWWLGGVIGTTAEQRAALGLGTAAVANVTTSVIDTTAGRVMRVGDFGIGTDSQPTNIDPNTVRYGSVMSSASQPNAPSPECVIWSGGRSAGARSSQLAIDHSTTARAWIRNYNSGRVGAEWSPWSELWASASANAITVDTGSIGYGTGSGGTVTQATSKSTTVTLHKPSGRITMSAESLVAGASPSFIVNNSKVSITDCVLVTPVAGTGASSYRVEVMSISSGSFIIRVTNISGLTIADALQINFVVIKGATA